MPQTFVHKSSLADDTKVVMVVESEDQGYMLQAGIDRLELLHLFINEYTMGGRVLDKVDSGKDVGVLVH